LILSTEATYDNKPKQYKKCQNLRRDITSTVTTFDLNVHSFSLLSKGLIIYHRLALNLLNSLSSYLCLLNADRAFKCIFFKTGVGIQGFTLMRLVLCHMRHAFFVLVIFDRVSYFAQSGLVFDRCISHFSL
jgi:hypothetical protein